MSNQIFQTLKELLTPLSQSQCVLHKHELLICGGYEQRACYSYHTLKNEYKFICEYPSDVKLIGHCVLRLVDNNKHKNQITLLSFGGFFKHTLMMKYVSVWSNTSNKSNELSHYNQWIPFIDNHNHRIIIGKNENHNYNGVRAVIGGVKNNLLFITYPSKDISVFDLNIFQFIKNDELPTKHSILYHCLDYQFEYDEDNNTFKFRQLLVCDDIAPFNYYAYMRINDVILFFGGYCYPNVVSKSVHKYSIRENKWMTFQNTLPSPLCECVAILSEEDNYIHIIGGRDDKETTVSTHIKTNVRIFDSSLLVMICLFIDETK
ncbi:hypothetical protein RFI_00121 [Reticulomyxa filosa]|uniref:Kelch motif family protein n=1 Tax=Reticulomyxa filosa TaxID=46433 RepID=X6PFG6_RETFI|nr:hypothetical protein RFI_00121 [Reticulomyxa filosa]|eukprot:ETO36941.1 hypothetical protein RFI_00121 [Reticulomyxa filosa]